MPTTGTSARTGPELRAPLELPCGLVLKNRLAKAAMSDSLGDGAGNPSDEQIELYRRWSAGGAALSIIGEVQVDHRFPEKPGNLVLGRHSNDDSLRRLAAAGVEAGSHVWPQLGHAGALAHAPIARRAGPSSLDLNELQCDALSSEEIDALAETYARAATHAQSVGFSGVQIHAGHGFLLSQFLSPLFNHRTDRYGGSVEARSQLLVDIVRAVRSAVGPEFAVAMKINSSDQLEGGLTEDESLTAIETVGSESIDLLDISGGTYFPGAPASSDRRTSGPYFVDFSRRAKALTDTPLMVTGGFATREQATDAVSSGAADVVGCARSMVLNPALASAWLSPSGGDPSFPRFTSPPAGGVTAWYTMRLHALATGTDDQFDMTAAQALDVYNERDARREHTWRHTFEVGHSD